MNCDKCGSERILSVQAHSRDCTFICQGDVEHDGYVPSGLGIGGGDDVCFEFCLECGQMQGKFPIKNNLKDVLEE